MLAVPSIFIFLNLFSSLGLKRNKAAQWYTIVIFLKVLRLEYQEYLLTHSMRSKKDWFMVAIK
jgi:hypothetical protein